MKQLHITFQQAVKGQAETLELSDNVNFATGGVWIVYKEPESRFFIPFANINSIQEIEIVEKEEKKK